MRGPSLWTELWTLTIQAAMGFGTEIELLQQEPMTKKTQASNGGYHSSVSLGHWGNSIIPKSFPRIRLSLVLPILPFQYLKLQMHSRHLYLTLSKESTYLS